MCRGFNGLRYWNPQLCVSVGLLLVGVPTGRSLGNWVVPQLYQDLGCHQLCHVCKGGSLGQKRRVMVNLRHRGCKSRRWNSLVHTDRTEGRTDFSHLAVCSPDAGSSCIVPTRVRPVAWSGRAPAEQGRESGAQLQRSIAGLLPKSSAPGDRRTYSQSAEMLRKWKMFE